MRILPSLPRSYWLMFAVFAATQLIILFLPVSPTVASLMVAWFDAVIACIAMFGRVPLAAAVAMSIAVARTLISLNVTGLPVRVASMTHIDLFFLLVLVMIANCRKENP